ncbi:hypothetical protein [Mesobacillus zeae]|uniref:Uncharacterized protein n=1 Tax=Mesobacillus zeae TaxID=1917180 RepID=A0A398BID2_9BACI|nr:hypothetical protein [Mesobacillus zeae]RID88308.1 hypothetical protein D1970_02090 [Mesobacillus zeae]
MKAIGSLLCAGVIATSLVFVPSGAVLASDDDCNCDVTMLNGAERNKLVAGLFKSDSYKSANKQLREKGLKREGANKLEVIRFNADGSMYIGVPFADEKGAIEFFPFSVTETGFVPMFPLN